MTNQSEEELYVLQDENGNLSDKHEFWGIAIFEV